MLCFSRLKSSSGVHDLEYGEFVVVVVQLFKSLRLDSVLQGHDSKVPDLNGVGNAHVSANRDGRQAISIFEKLKACSASKGLSLKLHDERLTVLDLEEHVEVVLHEVFHVILWSSSLD
jgi:hypothetical protein